MADLVTLDAVKQDLNITNTNDDAQLKRLITEISAWILNQMNRGAILQASYTERRSGTGGDQIQTKYFPIISVESLSVNGIAVPSSPDSVQPGFVFDGLSIFMLGGTCLNDGSLHPGQFWRGRQNVQISYTAGYATVPADIERAVIDQIVFTFRRLPKLGTITQSMGGVTTATFSQKDTAPGVTGVINQYRDRALVGL
jgi:hypothetical protein